MHRNIDLGGYGTADYPELAQEGDFSFRCAGCGGCCRNRDDIVLSGYDLYRLCRRLQLPPEMVIHGFCEQYIGRSSDIPVVRLKPKKNGNCPFLWENRCAVHDGKPLVCALYPLGQTIHIWPELNPDDPQDRRRAVRYFAQDTGCSGEKIQLTLGQYLDGFGIREREPLDVRWARDCLALVSRVRGLRGRLRPVERSYLNRKIVRALYLDYDFCEDFFPQYDRNIAELERVLTRLEGGR